ncbi:MAG: hypothetical protein COT91_05335 [Candidatus Doudnabacteria bacterium CG10_big_fil_rev_8_21_14_0_10_41_10]|uniref:Shikimate kinase n=1 Tax=Candidatus Doudnabacteria bacterium CG10_big_fil_rev_8_21_14_0_10_41_10 TaxID=1974551 RepID=A0A2H0VC49_9BACT|nr:MAG: hypothetical protein COT91_05335 [Candidatus Doudnabacteria bacterium CG10_big_fil_rev_8_21_14_0_10_41_10]
MIIFLIGPGGVGKTTCGKLLAKKIGYELIDLDKIFQKKLGGIGRYIDQRGYRKYCYQNSKIFYSLLKANEKKSVFVLSSGFLVHKGLERLTTKHRLTINRHGLSVLLLPSRSRQQSTKIIVERQLSRALGLNKRREIRKIEERYDQYLKFGDIRIFSYAKPETIVNRVTKKLYSHPNFK